MQHHTFQGRAPSHGFKVGVATLAMTAVYEWFLSQPVEKLDPAACVSQWPSLAEMEKKIAALFPEVSLREKALEETRAKYISAEMAKSQVAVLKKAWPEIKARLGSQLIAPGELRGMLRAAGAPVMPEQIGIFRERMCASFSQAVCIRRRFTLLDVLQRLGWFEKAVKVFSENLSFWAPPKTTPSP
jgi:glycerol-1-phosphate dehydrogenase [NAD(P)+]